MKDINVRQLNLLRARVNQHLASANFFDHEQRIKFADAVSTVLSGCEREDETVDLFEYLNELDDFLDRLNDMGGKFTFKDDGTIAGLAPVSKEDYKGILERCFTNLNKALPKANWEPNSAKY